MRPEHSKLVDEIVDRKLTFLRRSALIEMCELVSEISRSDVPGIFIECGAGLGGSSIAIAAVRPENRAFKVFDMYGLIPEPTQQDGEDAHTRYSEIISEENKQKFPDYYGYQSDLLNQVKQNYASVGVSIKNIDFIQGDIRDTLIVEEPVAFVHIDCDWYEPVEKTLSVVSSQLSVGGAIIIDDYDYWSGCRKAVDEFLQEQSGRFRAEERERLTIFRQD
ncbi:Macrocin-O-methyltransferase (TylF) [Roseovarius marisflavi]|uniref:Macrocin-O-methyltransferase (TylF) n=1 Tax=Roseovarius marisflavi TaxID=1054996 RepID=A0A1M6Y452_9RHOB|nr:TylF/MycF/NovP-related O-methyltransferase [Roseovarius marisflavi]SHL12893.1 Macrocin-O-methyltransferase (TylF) [Roseovarius marisflavi]